MDPTQVSSNMTTQPQRWGDPSQLMHLLSFGRRQFGAPNGQTPYQPPQPETAYDMGWVPNPAQSGIGQGAVGPMMDGPGSAFTQPPAWQQAPQPTASYSPWAGASQKLVSGYAAAPGWTGASQKLVDAYNANGGHQDASSVAGTLGESVDDAGRLLGAMNTWAQQHPGQQASDQDLSNLAGSLSVAAPGRGAQMWASKLGIPLAQAQQLYAKADADERANPGAQATDADIGQWASQLGIQIPGQQPQPQTPPYQPPPVPYQPPGSGSGSNPSQPAYPGFGGFGGYNAGYGNPWGQSGYYNGQPVYGQQQPGAYPQQPSGYGQQVGGYNPTQPYDYTQGYDATSGSYSPWYQGYQGQGSQTQGAQGGGQNGQLPTGGGTGGDALSAYQNGSYGYGQQGQASLNGDSPQTALYRSQVMAPNKIDARNWGRMSPDDQKFSLNMEDTLTNGQGQGAYSDSDVTNAIQNSLPKFQSARYGAVE